MHSKLGRCRTRRGYDKAKLDLEEAGSTATETAELPQEHGPWKVMCCACLLLLQPLLSSQQRRRTQGAMVGVAIIVVVQVSCFAYYSKLQKDMMTAMEKKDEDLFYQSLRKVGLLILFILPGITLQDYCGQVVKLMARAKITTDLVKSYFGEAAGGGSTFYQLQLSGDIDNPDQRMCQDSQILVAKAFDLFFEIVISFGTSIGMVGVLFLISPSACAGIAVYGILGSAASVLGFGPILVRYNHELTKQEANLRYVLIRTRENAEQVAFFRGGPKELALFTDFFGKFLHTAYRSIVVQVYQKGFNTAFHWATFAVVPLLVGPKIIHGEIEFGAFAQAQMAFYAVFHGLTKLTDKLNDASDLATRLQRLKALQQQLEHAGAGSKPSQFQQGAERNCITLEEQEPTSSVVLQLQGVTVLTPFKADIQQRTLIRDLSLQLLAGQALLVSGASGIGKSSLLRAIAGLWCEGSGCICRVGNRSTFFIPQKPYMSLGTLREQLLYPQEGGSAAATDSEIEVALRQVNLHYLLEQHRLDSVNKWADLLSLGEQQRVSFARVLLQKDIDLVLLDEATSACDSANEAMLYRCLRQRVSTYVSIGHRPSLRSFHTQLLKLRQAAEEEEAAWSMSSLANAAAAGDGEGAAEESA